MHDYHEHKISEGTAKRSDSSANKHGETNATSNAKYG